jgi:hypothetical protein
MKTITEFHVATLKNAHKTRTELLAAGKTAEELPVAMGEALKLEGDKLTNMIAALEFVEADAKSKTLDLKRVIVSTLAEKETTPKSTLQKGDFYFTIEYFPPLPGQEKKAPRGRDDDRGGRGRDGKRGGGKGKGKGGPRGASTGAKDNNNNRGDRPNRGPRPEGAPGENRPPVGARPPREPRAPRPPRPPRIPIVPPVNDGLPRFKVIVKSAGETPSAPLSVTPTTETSEANTPKPETT